MNKAETVKLVRAVLKYDEAQKEYFDRLVNLPMRKNEVEWHLQDGIKLPWATADDWEDRAMEGLKKRKKEIQAMEKSLGEKAWCF